MSESLYLMGVGNLKLILYTCAVNFLSFAVGNAYSWSSAVIVNLKSNDTESNPIGRPITSTEESWIVSLVSLGATTGCLVSGFATAKFGRKKTLLMFAVPMLLSQLILAFATSPREFFVARFMVGLGAGCVLTVIPMYVGEIAKTEIRGLMGCILGIFISSGNLFVYIIGPFVHLKTLSFILMIPLLLFLFFFGCFGPESPYYYVIIGKEEAAQKSLSKLRKERYRQNELLVIKSTISNSFEEKISFSGLWNSRSFRKGIIISTTLVLLMQLVGITIILGYMANIFSSSGSTISPTVSTIIVSSVQTSSVVVTSYVVDKLGRKFLLVIANFGITLSLLTLALYFTLKNSGVDVSSLWWLPVSSLILYIITYKLGLGTLPWALAGELFSTKTKSLAASITSTTCLFFAFITSLIFPTVKALIGLHGVFWLFTASGLMSFLFVLFYVPETRGKSFQEIIKMLES